MESLVAIFLFLLCPLVYDGKSWGTSNGVDGFLLVSFVGFGLGKIVRFYGQSGSAFHCI